ncbi:unnamed protein product [Leptosia nina]|uniref:Endonuclease III homolog n=1 Tax=Leptosia nina TaxID=320188 RepID=A0AAV1JFL8_9NEOP
MPRKKLAQTLTKNPNSENTTRDELDRKELPESKLDTKLNQFKFEKKPHIKIEFENDSPKKQEGKGLWEPLHWREFLLNLQNMRANNDAPVDSMGCHMCMDENASPKVIRYQSLISLMLSSQTKDQVTFAAMQRLKQRGLTVDNVLSMSDEELGNLIYPVGFWKTKVKYIKKTTQTLKEQYDSDIPDSVEKLCKLTGVGPKMAHICMKVAWNKITGIGVDTHVHRISNRIGWVKKPTTTPEDTRKALQSWLPFDLWSEVNHLMVGFGQTICLPVGPNCEECLNSDICPSKSTRKTPKKSPSKSEPASNVKTSPSPKIIKPLKKSPTLNTFDKNDRSLPVSSTVDSSLEQKSPTKRKFVKNLNKDLESCKGEKIKERKLKNIENTVSEQPTNEPVKDIKTRKSPQNQSKPRNLKSK